MPETALLDAARAWSGVLRRKLERDPVFADWLADAAMQPVDAACIQNWHEELTQQSVASSEITTAAVRQGLRRLRQRVFFTLMVRDVNGQASFQEVVQATTHLAELALTQSYQHVMDSLTQLHGVPLDAQTGLPQEMLVLGMGKLGGRELNVSSDIDLIMLYGSEGETVDITAAGTSKRRISHHEFYAKLTQRMMPILSDLDGDGQVFRTDLRLRPDGDSGALALSLPALEHYLITQGREWERYAWVKARPLPMQALAGSQPQAQWEELENLRRPFVYRKYFDFDALNALRNLRERIRQDWQRKALKRNGVDATHNIKLGDGGIREIEFIIQLNQLIRGGQQPSLQQRRLLKALQRQKTAGILPADVADGLEQAYVFLRRLEHMLQYREDQQTHLLPSQPQQWAALAQALGLAQNTFRQTLDGHRQFVHQTFRNAFRLVGMGETDSAAAGTSVGVSSSAAAARDAAGSLNSPLEQVIHENMAEDASAVYQRIQLMLDSVRTRTLSINGRTRLEALLPSVIRAAAQTEHPATTANRLLNLIEAISQRSAYLALLTEYPDTLARVARIMSASPWAAQYLHQYPLLLDSLIEWHSLMEALDLTEVASELNIELDNCLLPDGSPDVEQQMNLLRDVQHQTTFQLLAQDLNEQLSVETLADQLSALADLCLQTIVERVWPVVRDKHQPRQARQTAPQFAILAYGKLGGKELGYASDLDLVFVYEDSSVTPPDDAFNAADCYTRLARRVTSWLTTLTSSGRLYDVDLRLRPDGDAGLLAVPMTAFEQYQRQHAWPWEHQALTRARFVTGDAALGERFEALRREILLLPREAHKLRGDVQAMREKIAAGHQNRSELFDLKHDPGGMVDIEFITQFLVLMHARHHPQLLGNLGNIALLGLAAEAGLIPTPLARCVADSYRHYRKTQHALRLQGAHMARADPAQFSGERACVQALWQIVIAPQGPEHDVVHEIQ